MPAAVAATGGGGGGGGGEVERKTDLEMILRKWKKMRPVGWLGKSGE